MADKRLQLLLELKDKALAPLRSIQAGSQDAAKALADTRAKLKQLNTQQAALGNFEKSTAALRESSTQLKVLRQNLQTLQATGQGSTAQVKQLQAAIEKQTSKFKDQQTKVLELRTSLTRLGITNVSQTQQRLGTDIAATTAKIDAQKNALKQLGDQQKRLDALKSQHGRAMAHAGMAAGAGVAMVAAGRTMARPVQATLGAFSEQENASTQLSASMMLADGSISKNFKPIEQLAKRLGDRLPGTTADFIDLMAVLKQQGLGDETILGGTGEAAALLGVQLRMSIPAAGEFAAKMQDATRTAEKDMMGLMDTIQRSHYMGVDDGNMLQGFSKMSPVMSILNKEGLEFSNMMAPLLVMMDQTGMAGESAGNAIRKVFQGGLNTKKLEKANELLKSSKAGFQLKFTDKGGAFLGMDNVFGQLEKLKGLGNNAVLRTGVMQALFGDDSETLQVLNTMMDKGKSGYQEIVEKMAAQASLQQRVEQQLRTLTNVTEAAQGGFTNVVASIGATVEGDAKTIIDAIGNITSTIGDWVKEHPVLTANIVRAVAVLAALTAGLGVLLIPLALIYGKVMLVRFGLGMLGIKLPSIVGGLRGVGASMAAAGGPLGLLQRGFGLLVRWGSALFRINPFAALAAGVFGFAQSFISNLDGIKAAFQVGDWAAIGGYIVQGLEAGLNMATLGLYGTVKTVLGGLIDLVKSIFGIHSPSRVFADLGGMLMDGLVLGISKGLQAVKDALGNAATATINWFKKTLGFAAGTSAIALPDVSMAAAAGVASTAPVAIDRRPALSAPGAARPAPIVQGDTIAIHIQAAPGMDERAIAQIVRAELQRNEHAKTARLQNAFNDFG